VNRTVKASVLAIALLLASAIPAAAQTTGVGSSSLGVGLVFGSVGVGVDYSKVFRELSADKTLGWVIEGAFAHEGCGGFGVDCGVNLLTAQGGVRIGGPIGSDGKLRWHGQGLIGIGRTSLTGDLDDACDIVEGFTDEGCSSTDVIFSPGAGINYAWRGNMSFTARVDIQIAGGDSGGRLWLGLNWSK